jgi:hypothetical protein
LQFRRMHNSPSVSVQFPADPCSSHLCHPLLSTVCRICVSQGVCEFAIALSRFHHKRISPSVART